MQRLILTLAQTQILMDMGLPTVCLSQCTSVNSADMISYFAQCLKFMRRFSWTAPTLHNEEEALNQQVSNNLFWKVKQT